ncbi:MAG: hypothetical protein EP332_10520 [Bacteroidetes bacterium]|nr:MAG: hypothetical protein EP332_10520 [Bacteroidota bacterium]
MASRFLSNFSFSLVLNLLVKLFWVFQIEVTVQNVLGTEAYGRYFEAFQFAYIFFILLDLGISNYNNRTVAGDASKLTSLFPSMLALKLILGLVYIAFLAGAAQVMSYDAEAQRLILFVGVNQALMSLMLFLRSNVSGLHLYKTDAVLSVLDRLVMGLICAAMLFLPWLDSFSIDHFLWAQFIGYATAVLLAFVTLFNKGIQPKLVFKFSLLKDILHKSYTFALLFFLMGLYTRVDSVMLGRLLENGEFETGLYASAFRILDAAIIFTVLLSNLLLPMFSRFLAKGEDPAPLVRESYRVVLVVATILPLATWFFSDELYALMYKHNQEAGGPLFGFLMLNFIPMAFGYIFGTLLTAKGEMKLLNLISVGGLALNLALNFWLIPKHGAMGATAATILTQSLVTISTIYFTCRFFKLGIYDFLSIRVISFVVSSIGVFYLVAKLEWSLWPSLVLAGLGAAAMSLLFRVFNWRELLDMIRLGKGSSSTT